MDDSHLGYQKNLKNISLACRLGQLVLASLDFFIIKKN
jgi:hypothetical protein